MQRRRSALLTALLITAATPLAHAGATGTVSYKGQSWPVADAMASAEMLGYTKLAFAPVRWDRVAWADNEVFDMFDIYSFEQSATPLFLEIKLDREGKFSSLRMSQDFAKHEGEISQPMAGKPDWLDGVNIERFSADAVAGHAKFQRGDYAVDVKFELDVLKRDAKLKMPGDPLPADGGEPGQALLASLAAAAAGDVPRMLELAHPDRRERMSKERGSKQFAAQMSMLKSTTPTDPKISGGNINADQAVVDFSGSNGGQVKQYSATLSRVDGVWYVERLSTRDTK